MYTRVVVPLDGSTTAERALPHAERLLAKGGTLILVTVVEPGLPLSHLDAVEIADTRDAAQLARDVRKAMERPREAAAAYLAGAVRKVVRGDVSVATRVLEGNPVERIVEAARDAELVVMSTHGRTGMARFLIGSVAEGVVRHAPVPVLVVR